jgi:hypothetical protein
MSSHAYSTAVLIEALGLRLESRFIFVNSCKETISDIKNTRKINPSPWRRR